MDTTTPDGGATAQPQEPEAVTTGHNADQVITTDDNGTPTMQPVTSEAQAEEAATEPTEESTDESVAEEAQAPLDDDIVAWTEKKGLKINPDNPNELKLAQMQRDAERAMHAANQIKSVEPAEELPLIGDPNYDAIAERLNRREQVDYVRSWFDANPQAKEARSELQEIASRYPELTNMDHIYAHYLANPKREAELKRAGGKEALTNLAQKQQQIPPGANATNSGVYESQTITPQNVYDLVDKHDQEWFEKNHQAISKAMSGK